MKKILFILVFGSLIFLIPACSKFTEITPKGVNVLNTVSDLDALLNYNYSTNGSVSSSSVAATYSAQNAFSANDVGVLVNDIYPADDIPSLIASKVQSLNYAYTVYDETVDRKSLAGTDIKYEKLYFIINNVTNVVLKNADGASGDQTKARQLKAEAYILRAYLHFLLVNFYAKGYNPSTAATDGGIPYVKEGNIVADANKKSTVAEVYTDILSDIDAAFALNSLPATPINNMRAGLAFAYGVKAQVLISMHNYSGALAAANSSLAINNTLFDDRLYQPVGSVTFGKALASSPENLFFMGAANTPLFTSPSLEITNNYYEPGNVIDSYVKPYYPVNPNPLTGIAGKLWYYLGGPYAINTAGLTTSDTYLIKAECLTRAGDLAGAMTIVNTIRQLRIHPSIYTPVSAATEGQAMAFIMKVSRIECLYSMKNFINLKRWNTDDVYKQTITRTVNGVTYSLSPGSPLWIFPFPQSGAAYNPNLTQNY